MTTQIESSEMYDLSRTLFLESVPYWVHFSYVSHKVFQNGQSWHILLWDFSEASIH